MSLAQLGVALRPSAPSPSTTFQTATARPSWGWCSHRRRPSLGWCCGSRWWTARHGVVARLGSIAGLRAAVSCLESFGRGHLAVGSRSGGLDDTGGFVGGARSRSTCRPVAPCGCAAGSAPVATTGPPFRGVWSNPVLARALTPGQRAPLPRGRAGASRRGPLPRHLALASPVAPLAGGPAESLDDALGPGRRTASAHDDWSSWPSATPTTTSTASPSPGAGQPGARPGVQHARLRADGVRHPRRLTCAGPRVPRHRSRRRISTRPGPLAGGRALPPCGRTVAHLRPPRPGRPSGSRPRTTGDPSSRPWADLRGGVVAAAVLARRE